MQIEVAPPAGDFRRSPMIVATIRAQFQN